MGKHDNSEVEEAKYSSSSSSDEEQKERGSSKRKKKNSKGGSAKKRNVNKGGDNGTKKTNKKDSDSVSRKRSYEKDDDENEEEEEGYRAKRAARTTIDVFLRIIVPSKEIGKVIGRKGANIKQLREETGAWIKIADPVSALEERVIIISSKAEENEEKSAAEHALIRIVNVILEGNEGTTATTTSGSRHVGPNMIRLLIADSQAGSLIGHSGETIKQTRRESGASVRIMARNQLPLCASASETDRLVQISGEVPQVLKALEHIGATLRENPPKEVVSTRPAYYLAPGAVNRLMLLPESVLSAYGAQSDNLDSPYSRSGRKVEALAELGASSLPKVAKEISVPSYVVGALIGKKGSNISEIRSRSGATVKVADEKDVGTRVVYIEGTTEQVDIAQDLIDSYINVEES